jgi:mono/diheme cytochrome c family protein
MDLFDRGNAGRRPRSRAGPLPTARITIALAVANVIALPAYGQEAKQLFEQTCAMCHGTGGKGDGPTSQSLQPKPADLTVVVKDKSDAYLTKLITEGGPSVGKSPLMPAYKGILSEKQIESVIQYVRGLAAP